MSDQIIAQETTKKLSSKQHAARERERAIKDLAASVQPGSTVYYILRKYSSNGSGVNRCYAFFAIVNDPWNNGAPAIWNLTGRMAQVLGLRWNKDNDGVWSGTHVHANEIVQDLGRVLYSSATALETREL